MRSPKLLLLVLLVASACGHPVNTEDKPEDQANVAPTIIERDLETTTASADDETTVQPQHKEKEDAGDLHPDVETNQKEREGRANETPSKPAFETVKVAEKVATTTTSAPEPETTTNQDEETTATFQDVHQKRSDDVETSEHSRADKTPASLTAEISTSTEAEVVKEEHTTEAGETVETTQKVQERIEKEVPSTNIDQIERDGRSEESDKRVPTIEAHILKEDDETTDEPTIESAETTTLQSEEKDREGRNLEQISNKDVAKEEQDVTAEEKKAIENEDITEEPSTTTEKEEILGEKVQEERNARAEIENKKGAEETTEAVTEEPTTEDQTESTKAKENLESEQKSESNENEISPLKEKSDQDRQGRAKTIDDSINSIQEDVKQVSGHNRPEQKNVEADLEIAKNDELDNVEPKKETVQAKEETNVKTQQEESQVVTEEVEAKTETPENKVEPIAEVATSTNDEVDAKTDSDAETNSDVTMRSDNFETPLEEEETESRSDTTERSEEKSNTDTAVETNNKETEEASAEAKSEENKDEVAEVAETPVETKPEAVAESGARTEEPVTETENVEAKTDVPTKEVEAVEQKSETLATTQETPTAVDIEQTKAKETLVEKETKQAATADIQTKIDNLDKDRQGRAEGEAEGKDEETEEKVTTEAPEEKAIDGAEAPVESQNEEQIVNEEPAAKEEEVVPDQVKEEDVVPEVKEEGRSNEEPQLKEDQEPEETTEPQITDKAEEKEEKTEQINTETVEENAQQEEGEKVATTTVDSREGRKGIMSEIFAAKSGSPIIEKGPNTIHFFKPKEPFVLVCQGFSESGSINYSWLKNGRPFHLDGEAGHLVFRESPFDGNIIFVSPGPSDVGTYQCVAENKNGKVFSHPSLVMVQKPLHEPRGLDLFKTTNAESRTDSDANLEVVGAANPADGKQGVFVVLPTDNANQDPAEVIDMQVVDGNEEAKEEEGSGDASS